MRLRTVFLWLIYIILISGPAFSGHSEDSLKKEASDWPQWRGPNRDGVSEETGLIKTLPESGPQVLWRREIGAGYSGIAVSAHSLYTMYCQGDFEYVLCLDTEGGLQVWEFLVDKIFLNQHGSGPRSTPIVEDNRVYALSAKGKLYCLRTSDGKRFWQVDLSEHLGADLPRFGFTTSPMILDDKLIMEVGDASGNSIVAFDKQDGSIVWRTHTNSYNGSIIMDDSKDKPGYSSPILIKSRGQKQIIFFTSSQLIGLSPEGSLLWRKPWHTRNGANVAAPIFVPDDRLFISSGYNKGASMWQINQEDATLALDKLWQNKVMRCRFSSAVYHNKHIYGFDRGTLKCVDVETGKKKWKQGGMGHGSLLYADGQLIILSENGTLYLVDATHEKFRQRGEAEVFNKGKCWTPPALANGRLFVRNQFEILCLNLKQ